MGTYQRRSELTSGDHQERRGGDDVDVIERRGQDGGNGYGQTVNETGSGKSATERRASKLAQPILDLTRVSPYRPAAN